MWTLDVLWCTTLWLVSSIHTGVGLRILVEARSLTIKLISSDHNRHEVSSCSFLHGLTTGAAFLPSHLFGLIWDVYLRWHV